MDIVSAMNGHYIAAGPKGHSFLLDEAMPARTRAAQLSVNVLKAVTVTLRPSLHGIEPLFIRRMIRDISKAFICKVRNAFFCEIHYEFTKALVLHMHVLLIGRKTTVSRIVANYRQSFGFLCVKDIHSLQGWVKYMSKEDVYPPNYYFNK